jgi:redox-sensitive bicupin YhaK (pirin superfamily)
MTVIKNRVQSTSHAMGPLTVNRVMPQQTLTPVGAFVFLDHFDIRVTPEQMPKPDGTLAHPHRGIATLTYLLSGEVTHLDSYGHKGTIGSGGVQWMKAGNGIVHDEWAKPADSRLAGLQFWLNLSAKGKAEKPEYKAITSKQLPQVDIGNLGSSLKVIIGKYKSFSSDISTESRQVLYHLSVKAGEEIELSLNKDDQYAAFLASGFVHFSGQELKASHQGHLKDGLDKLVINAMSDSELFVYGGEKYQEPIVSGGPFIMNSEQEIANAYKDYHAGKYGDINYLSI